MSSQDTQIPNTILFPRAAVALARMSAVTLMVTFGLTILFLAAAILISPGGMRSALAVAPEPAPLPAPLPAPVSAPVSALEAPQQALQASPEISAGPRQRGGYDF